MSRLLVMYDAVTPQSVPAANALAFYIGGDTPHVWTQADLDRATQRYRLPIWVRSNPAGHDGKAEAQEAVAKLRSYHGAPHAGITIALDYETAVDAAYEDAFKAEAFALGYHTILYGSLSVVERNPRPDEGYWVAAWDGSQTLEGGEAHQFVSRSSYDLSVIDSNVPLWDMSPPVPVKPPVKPPVPPVVHPPVPTPVGHAMPYSGGWATYLTILPDPMGVDFPVEPAGTLEHPQGSILNAQIYWSFAPQHHDGTLEVFFHLKGGGWNAVETTPITLNGDKRYFPMPTDGSVDKIRVKTDVVLTALVTGRMAG